MSSLAHFSSSCCCPGGVACCSGDFWCWRRSSAARGGRSSGESETSWPGERTRRKNNQCSCRLVMVEKYDQIVTFYSSLSNILHRKVPQNVLHL